MPRVARNIVEFVVDGLDMQAEFVHQHCKEDSSGALMMIPVYEDRTIITGGLLGSQRSKTVRKLVRTDYDSRVVEPVQPVEIGKYGPIELRHVTTCILSTRADGTPWEVVGTGVSKCSVKDKYNWRKGIKDSLERAIADAGIEKSGPVLFAFYSELPKRPTEVK